jgi:hypothetical protein
LAEGELDGTTVICPGMAGYNVTTSENELLEPTDAKFEVRVEETTSWVELLNAALPKDRRPRLSADRGPFLLLRRY